MVTELDPDATFRQKKQLDNEDEVTKRSKSMSKMSNRSLYSVHHHISFSQQNEKRLMEEIFSLIRAGKISEARQYCREKKQYWRAASLQVVDRTDTNTILSDHNFIQNINLWSLTSKRLAEEVNHLLNKNKKISHLEIFFFFVEIFLFSF